MPITIYAIHILIRELFFTNYVAGRPGSITADKNDELLEQALAQSQGMFIRRTVLELNSDKSTINLMLRKVIMLYLYLRQVVQTLHAEIYDAHLNHFSTITKTIFTP